MCIRDRNKYPYALNETLRLMIRLLFPFIILILISLTTKPCLLYTSDAADERSSVDLGGRRIIKKKKQEHLQMQLRHKNTLKYKHTVTQPMIQR